MESQRLESGCEQRLREVVSSYMAHCSGLESHCTRCLETLRWGGSVPLMIVDAAFMSIGLNYFTAVVPAVAAYEQAMNRGAVPSSLSELAEVSLGDVSTIWRNQRSWEVVRGVAACLREESPNDRVSLTAWAGGTPLSGWEHTPVGRVKGVGLNTYQYLRMMGGVDTSMPDKIVRRVMVQILEEAGSDLPTKGDLELISTIETISRVTGRRPIELTWMTWMVQSEGKTMRMEKYRELLQRI